MALEDDFKTIMEADAPLVSLLTGGIYTSGTVGRNGITRASAAGAFDSEGDLLPVALVRQRDLVPDGWIDGPLDVSANQVIEIWLYQESDYTAIDAALARLFQLFQGYQFSNSFPCEWINTIQRLRDDGALAGASLARQDWSVTIVQEVTDG